MEQPYYNFRNEPVAPPYVVVNQQPPQHNRFPISFNLTIVFVFGILKCIIGFLEFVFGVVNIFFLYYFTSYVAFPIWCGLIVSIFHFTIAVLDLKCVIETMGMGEAYQPSMNMVHTGKYGSFRRDLARASKI